MDGFDDFSCSDVTRFSAGMNVGITLDNLEENFAGEFMSRFADNVADSGIPRLLRLLMMIENVSSTLRMAREVIRSVHMVLAVQRNTGMRLYLDAYCFEIDRVSWGRTIVLFHILRDFLKCF